MFDDEEARAADRRRAAAGRGAGARRSRASSREVTDKKALLELVNQIDALKAEIANAARPARGARRTAPKASTSGRRTSTSISTRASGSSSRRAPRPKRRRPPPRPRRRRSSRPTRRGSTSSRRTTTARRSRACSRSSSSYPQSQLAPSAQYWIGNAHYALRDYKSAISAQQKLIATWPDSAKAPDAMLNIASQPGRDGRPERLAQDLERSSRSIRTAPRPSRRSSGWRRSSLDLCEGAARRGRGMEGPATHGPPADSPVPNPNAVVLLSGGLDSATVLAIARAEGYACHASRSTTASATAPSWTPPRGSRGARRRRAPRGPHRPRARSAARR